MDTATTTRTPSSVNEDEDEDYFLAPQSQRVFGAGIKRKRVAFVPASSSTTESTAVAVHQPQQPSKLGAKYLSIVLGGGEEEEEQRDGGESSPTTSSTTTTCPTCHTPLPPTLTAYERQTHNSSITHQLHQQHSHPPSHLDRHRKGLKYLQGYGWDPDGRVGLGARSEGITVPIKAAKEKRDTAGLGLFSSRSEAEDEDEEERKKKGEVREEETRRKGVRLSAKEMKKVEEEKKKRNEKLWNAFYGEDLSRYLGPGG